jgi:hypothetical protein
MKVTLDFCYGGLRHAAHSRIVNDSGVDFG